jgi:hypothetical protein
MCIPVIPHVVVVGPSLNPGALVMLRSPREGKEVSPRPRIIRKMVGEALGAIPGKLSSSRSHFLKGIVDAT